MKIVPDEIRELAFEMGCTEAAWAAIERATENVLINRTLKMDDLCQKKHGFSPSIDSMIRVNAEWINANPQIVFRASIRAAMGAGLDVGFLATMV